MSPLRKALRRLIWDENNCLVYTGSTRRGGYGQVRNGNRMQSAHRFMYEQLVGPIPDGLDLDHLCRVRACTSPAHLEPVTRRTNLLRSSHPSMVRARADHCAKGHEFTPENTIQADSRRCRTCTNDQQRANYARRTAKKESK